MLFECSPNIPSGLLRWRHTLPKRSTITDRRKWFHFSTRKDIKSVSLITLNHMICCIHFQGGLGYCKADPVPTFYNDLEWSHISIAFAKETKNYWLIIKRFRGAGTTTMFCSQIAMSRMYVNFVERENGISSFQQILAKSKIRAGNANSS